MAPQPETRLRSEHLVDLCPRGTVISLEHPFHVLLFPQRHDLARYLAVTELV